MIVFFSFKLLSTLAINLHMFQ